MMQQQITDKNRLYMDHVIDTVVSFQPHPLFCIAWEALKKNINGLVNKVTMVTPVYPPCDVVTVTGECVQHS